MQLNATQTKAAIVCLVLAVIGVGYLLWIKTAVPTPELAPGQTIATPFGIEAARGPAGAREMQREAPNAQGALTNTGTGQNSPRVPAPGTVDPKLGFGPSPNAPIPR